MRSKWISPVAAVAVMTLAACGGGGEQTSRTSRRAKAPAAGETAPTGGNGYMAMAVADGGSVTGTVNFEGTPPPPETIEVSKDTAICGEEKLRETVKVGAEGGLADAVVWIDGITKGKEWGSMPAAAVDQKECTYSPHIQLAKAGETFEILNSDSVLHNIHAYHDDTETLFNLAQPIQGMKTPKTLEKTGPVHLKCDVHSWMSAWVFVAGHPYYALTDANGGFTLGDVPPGDYMVKAWHEKLGEKSMNVTVASGGAAPADFVMQ